LAGTQVTQEGVEQFKQTSAGRIRVYRRGVSRDRPSPLPGTAAKRPEGPATATKPPPTGPEP
jgi:hypothetical protein